MRTLFKAIDEIQKKNKETMVVYKSKRYGMIWAGKALFISNALTFEALHNCNFEIVYEENATIILVA